LNVNVRKSNGESRLAKRQDIRVPTKGLPRICGLASFYPCPMNRPQRADVSPCVQKMISVRLMKKTFFFTLLTATVAFAADPKPVAETKPDPGPAPTAAETKALGELSKLGVEARPIAANINWRSASVRFAGTNADPKIYTLLKDVPSLQELDLAGLALTDAQLASIAKLTSLRVLHLEKTPTTDAMLAHVKGLKNLAYLNLYGTQITDAGLAQLKGLSSLKSLYVFETKVTDAGITALKSSLPNLYIEKGWTAEDIARLNAKPPPDTKAMEAEIAAAQKKLDGLNAELTKLKEALEKQTKDTPEFTAAEKKVKDKTTEITKATTALDAAKAKLVAAKSAVVEAEIAAAQKKLDGLTGELTKLKEALEKQKKETPEFTAAEKSVKDKTAEITKATTTLDEAKAKLKK
jgi:hypothetical protein